MQIVPSRHGTAESREAIRTTGLERYMKPLKLKDGGPIDVKIQYVSDETLVQEDEVGNTYVFKKMTDSYPIPYAACPKGRKRMFATEVFADHKSES